MSSVYTGEPKSSDAQAAQPAAAAVMADGRWYKDAVIYQLHVKAFFDSNNDGIGDFKGLAAKLDYIQELGVNAIWLLPFYPSPLKDDGYDIADYHNVHPHYGTRDDFRSFVHEAHRRGPEGDHRAGDQPHLRPAPLVPGGAARARGLAQARLLRLERHRPEVQGHAHHLHRHRDLELDLGPGGEGLLLAPLLQPPARPQLRQPAACCRRCCASCASGSTWASTASASTRSPTSSSARAPTTRTCPRRTRC